MYSLDPYIKMDDPLFDKMCICDICGKEGSIATGILKWDSSTFELICRGCLINMRGAFDIFS